MYHPLRAPLLLTLLSLFLLPLISADNSLYLKDGLQAELSVTGQLDLIPENNAARIEELTVHLLLYPQNDYRQTLVDIDSTGTPEQNTLKFFWDDGTLGTKQFGYTALISTTDARPKVKKRIPFPLTDVNGYEEYLQPTTTIDATNLDVIRRAADLAEGEDDLFKVVFNLASWVEENVKYDLNTLTASASQKASWVLEHKEGVCDELTSLFIAMARSLGIPARFVSGISYTTSELFSEEWQPHGWAEVYFPDIGWVPFDMTFGEYGYVDVTHLKLRDGLDPTEAATKYEWLANKVQLQAHDLDFAVDVQKEGRTVPEPVLLETEILADDVGPGSYNLVTGIIKNSVDYYVATTLQLAVPEEVEILGRNKRTVLLHPREVRETTWLVRSPPDVQADYLYTFPLIMYTERNTTVQNSFTVQQGAPLYSQEDVAQLQVADEEKSYSRQITFTCDYPTEVRLQQEFSVQCRMKNSGNTNLQHVRFCLGDSCEVVDLPINQEAEKTVTVQATTVGWNKLVVSAENGIVEKKSALPFVVLEDPAITIVPLAPETVQLGELLQFTVQLQKGSFSVPQQVVVTLDGAGFTSTWEIAELSKDQELPVVLENYRLSGTNTFTLTVHWTDKEGKAFTAAKEIIIRGEAAGLGGKVQLLLNKVLNWFG